MERVGDGEGEGVRASPLYALRGGVWQVDVESEFSRDRLAWLRGLVAPTLERGWGWGGGRGGGEGEPPVRAAWWCVAGRRGE